MGAPRRALQAGSDKRGQMGLPDHFSPGISHTPALCNTRYMADPGEGQ